MTKARQQQIQRMRELNSRIREQTAVSERKFMRAVSQVSMPQIHVLLAVAKYKPCTMSMIAKATHLTHGNITQTVERLEDKKLLKRSHSLEDRRVVNVELTAKGRNITEKHDESINQIFNHWFNCLDQEEINQLFNIFEKIVE